jgi:beta-galactosidase
MVRLVPAERLFMIYYCEEAAIQDADYTGGFKDIYESLKLLNLPVGFTTPSEIVRVDPRKQILIVPPTPYIADDSLARMKTFQQSGGRVVLVSPGRSFMKNEMGVNRAGEGLKKPFATLSLSGVLQMAGDFDTALASVRPAMPIGVKVTDEAGKKAYGVIIQQSRDPDSGEVHAILNNVSKDMRVVRLNASESGSGHFTNMLTRRPVENEMTLEPCDVYVIRREH